MIIRNLTSEPKKIIIKEITGDRKEYDIYLVPNGVTEIIHATISNMKDVCDFIEVDGVSLSTPKVEEITAVENESEIAPQDVVEVPVEDATVIEEVVEEPEVAADSYICDICGAEFASARSLNSHKSRVHAE